MDWCVADAFDHANHNPIPALAGDVSKRVLTIGVQAGASVTLSAEGTQDPDGDDVSMRWYVYQEAGTANFGAVPTASEGLSTDIITTGNASGALHVILDVKDAGDPPLSAYRRVIIEAMP
jgi:hypothetical protein